MKKTIKGQRYDTSTATRIAHCNYSTGKFCLWWRDESLWITPGGKYFLLGHGGPLSHWGTRRTDGNTYGRGLRALTADQAYVWLEQEAVQRPPTPDHTQG